WASRNFTLSGAGLGVEFAIRLDAANIPWLRVERRQSPLSVAVRNIARSLRLRLLDRQLLKGQPVRLRLIIIASLLFIQLVSFASAQNVPDTSQKKNSIYAEIGNAPDKARARQNPFRNDREAIAAGGILYTQHCAECHGRKPKAEREDQVFSSRKSRAPNQARFSGF